MATCCWRRIAWGQFHHVDGRWAGQWRPLEGLSGAVIVEGLGMGLLRLLSGEKTVAEYRFSLRHAKAVAKLQRKLERRFDNKDEADLPPEKGRPDEKKIRCEICGNVIPPWSETCPKCISKRKVLSRLTDFIKPYKWQAATGFALALLVTIDQLIRPALTKPMLDKGLGLGTGGLGHGDYVLLLKYVGILTGLILLAAVTGATRQRLMGTLGSKISRDIRDRTYEHLHKLSLSYFSKRPTGSLVTRITSDSDRIWDFVAFTVIDASHLHPDDPGGGRGAVPAELAAGLYRAAADSACDLPDDLLPTSGCTPATTSCSTAGGC